jgi:hypothetical protein
VKTKLECPKCNNLFSAKGGNYKKHIDSCEGSYEPFIKLLNCKYCNIAFGEDMSTALRANHSRWCDNNPKRDSYKATNDGSQLRTKDAVEKRIESLKKAHLDGKYDLSYKARRGKAGTPHTEETKKHLRELALASPHRRLRRKMIEYNGIWLDSTWELELAKRLDSLEIKWVRPNPIPWVDNDGVTHNYFPDFYLKDYDLFLDPKNPQAIKVQKKKLDCILAQYSNIVILDNLDACKNYTP